MLNFMHSRFKFWLYKVSPSVTAIFWSSASQCVGNPMWRLLSLNNHVAAKRCKLSFTLINSKCFPVLWIEGSYLWLEIRVHRSAVIMASCQSDIKLCIFLDPVPLTQVHTLVHTSMQSVNSCRIDDCFFTKVDTQPRVICFGTIACVDNIDIWNKNSIFLHQNIIQSGCVTNTKTSVWGLICWSFYNTVVSVVGSIPTGGNFIFTETFLTPFDVNSGLRYKFNLIVKNSIPLPTFSLN